MESQPQNPEFRNNPENFHACLSEPFSSSVLCVCEQESSSETAQLHRLV